MLNYRLRNKSEVFRKHEDFIADNEREIDEALNQAGHGALQYVKINPQFTPRTGALQKATNYRVLRTGSGRLLRISNSKDYAAAIDGGARPHTIVPVARNYLRFVVRGRTIFAQRVNHPGNRPFKFLFRAHSAANRTFRQDMTERMAALAARF